MTTEETLKTLLNSYDAIAEEVEDTLRPRIERWVELQVAAGKMKEIPGYVEIKYSSHSDWTVCFEIEAWAETWQYGGREDYGSQELYIPFDFFSNPELYDEQARIDIEKNELKKAASEKQAIAQEKHLLLKRLAELNKVDK